MPEGRLESPGAATGKRPEAARSEAQPSEVGHGKRPEAARSEAQPPSSVRGSQSRPDDTADVRRSRASSDEVERPPLREPPRMRPPPAVVGLVGLGGLLALAYPFAVERALALLGPRAVAAAVTLLGAASLAVPLGTAGSLAPGRRLRAAVLALPALAVATGDVVFLLLVPAAIQGVLAAVFALSLRGGGSLLQEAARYLNPYAPEFIAPYCRKVTAIFAAILALQGAGVALLALRTGAGADPGWAFLAGVAVWAPLGAASVVEWAVRKSWFRYYTDGPLDRRLRRWLPPEDTAAGRRSLEYIRRKRRELGMRPPD